MAVWRLVECSERNCWSFQHFLYDGLVGNLFLKKESGYAVAGYDLGIGLISVISFAVNVFIFAYILKRAKVQKKNPWKEEIFVDTKDYQEAMARAK